MTPVCQMMHEVVVAWEQRRAWLLRAGPIAKQLNAESKRDVNNGD